MDGDWMDEDTRLKRAGPYRTPGFESLTICCWAGSTSGGNSLYVVSTLSSRESSSVVESIVANDVVAGSNPVSRSLGVSYSGNYIWL